MDYLSRIYTKALATLGKQILPNGHQNGPCSKSTTDDSMDLGAFFYHLSFYFSFIDLFIDRVAFPISDINTSSIRRARDTLSNLVMADIIDEDPTSEKSFRNSLCKQIVNGCSCLRVNLISIDHLMERFNNSLAKDSQPSMSLVD